LSQLGGFDLRPGQLAIHAVQHTNRQSERRSQPKVTSREKTGDGETDERGHECDLIRPDRGPAELRD
jgi:hypothetical protein